MPVPKYVTLSIFDEADVQGDILIGLQKKGQVFNFFRIIDADRFARDFPALIPEVSNLDITKQYENNVQANKNTPGSPIEKSGGQPLDKMNIAFTFSGYKELGMLQEADGNNRLLDEAFRQGQRQRAHLLGDDIANWLPQYTDREFHGVILVASYRDDSDEALDAALRYAAHFTDALRGSIEIVHHEHGRVRNGIVDGINQDGHEHFGFADGVSQPGVEGLSTPDKLRPDKGFPGQDLVKPGEFILGEEYSTETNNTPKTAKPPLGWMKNGSYMVFRRLNQDVPQFRKYTVDSWHDRASSEEQFAARLIGRWPSGSPVVINPVAPGKDGEDVEQNNDFDFGAKDPVNGDPPLKGKDAKQEKCPFSAHIRRMYMRSDADDDASERHRILRAGIAFGKDDDDDKGLLFVCYQNSIVDKFEFIQRLASNPKPYGVLKEADGIQLPPNDDVGVDVILASTSVNRTEVWREGDLNEAPPFVTARGGAYFFMPSISALKTMVGV